MNFLSQDDIQGRLRLLRYGLVVIIVTTMITTSIAPFMVVRAVGANINVTDVVIVSGIITGAVAILMVVTYVAYAYALKRGVDTAESA